MLVEEIPARGLGETVWRSNKRYIVIATVVYYLELLPTVGLALSTSTVKDDSLNEDEELCEDR